MAILYMYMNPGLAISVMRRTCDDSVHVSFNKFVGRVPSEHNLGLLALIILLASSIDVSLSEYRFADTVTRVHCVPGTLSVLSTDVHIFAILLSK